MRPAQKVAVIPARGGSTRIPRKNIKEFFGRPIIRYSIAVANRSGLFNDIYVSTEDNEIAEIAEKYEAKVLWRPDELAVNEVGTQEVMKHACNLIFGEDYTALDMACCIYPTAPLLTSINLTSGLQALRSNRYMEYAFSIGTKPLHDAGQFYWGYVRSFLRGEAIFGERSIIFPIEEERVCDINTMDDWKEAEEKYAKLNRNAGRVLEWELRKRVSQEESSELAREGAILDQNNRPNRD